MKLLNFYRLLDGLGPVPLLFPLSEELKLPRLFLLGGFAPFIIGVEKEAALNGYGWLSMTGIFFPISFCMSLSSVRSS